MSRMTPFTTADTHGVLHRPDNASGDALVLTHGAGGNHTAPVLVAAANAFCGTGFTVLRFDLPFRQRRPTGPPSPHGAAQDREGIRHAVSELRKLVPGRIILGGHSYGGRQSTMLAADEPTVAHALLLLSYPLHPPKKPEQLRTQHLPRLKTPCMFVHGTVDGFGTIEEMTAALKLIPARTGLLPVQGAGHDLKRGKIEWGVVIERVMRLAG